MSLSSSAAAFGALLKAAVISSTNPDGSPNPAASDPAVTSSFNVFGSVLAEWLPTNANVLPGTMSASGASVVGAGAIDVTGTAEDLGQRFATQLTAPNPPPTKLVETYTKLAEALIDAFNRASVNPASFVAPTSGGPLTGFGQLVFTPPTFDVPGAMSFDDPPSPIPS